MNIAVRHIVWFWVELLTIDKYLLSRLHEFYMFNTAFLSINLKYTIRKIFTTDPREEYISISDLCMISTAAGSRVSLVMRQ